MTPGSGRDGSGDCIFCAIVAATAPASVVYEDAEILAFFQEVFHTHLHVFPRFAGDTFGISADWSQAPARDELEEIAAWLRRSDADGDPSRQHS